MKGNTVLVWGLAEDSPTARVRECLARRDVPVVWLDQQHTQTFHIEVDLSDSTAGILHMPGARVPLADIRGAYLRPYGLQSLHALRNLAPESAAYRHCRAFEEYLNVWCETSTALVMNRLSAMTSNGSKPYQADIIRKYGFSVPETLITTDPAAVRQFWNRHGTIIYKSMSGLRSIVTTLNPGDRRSLYKVTRCPTQFQAWIPGVDHRVHVVGDQVFVSRIKSDSIDHRYSSDTLIESADIPAEISDRCYRLTRGLGLELSGVDLRLTPGGEWYCFEVNPSPGFTYYEDATGAPIGDAISATLSGHGLADQVRDAPGARADGGPTGSPDVAW